MKNIFCAKCQAVTPHKGSVDSNGEFLFECMNVVQDADGHAVLDEQGNPILCDRFVKFPADTDPTTFEQTLSAHEEANKGQVSVEDQEKTLQALLATDTQEINTLVEDTTPVTE